MPSSIADDPSSWTSKPKDLLGDAVKKGLDARGWGAIEADDGDVLRDYRRMRKALITIRDELQGAPASTHRTALILDFIKRRLRDIDKHGADE